MKGEEAKEREQKSQIYQHKKWPLKENLVNKVKDKAREGKEQMPLYGGLHE